MHDAATRVITETPRRLDVFLAGQSASSVAGLQAAKYAGATAKPSREPEPECDQLQELEKLTGEIKFLMDGKARPYYIGTMLKEIHDKRLYAVAGHIDFKAFIKAAGLARSTSFLYKKVADLFGPADLHLGISKLALLTNDGLSDEQRRDFVARGVPCCDETGALTRKPVADVGYRELKTLIKDLISRMPRERVAGLEDAIRVAVGSPTPPIDDNSRAS